MRLVLEDLRLLLVLWCSGALVLWPGLGRIVGPPPGRAPPRARWRPCAGLALAVATDSACARAMPYRGMPASLFQGQFVTRKVASLRAVAAGSAAAAR